MGAGEAHNEENSEAERRVTGESSRHCLINAAIRYAILNAATISRGILQKQTCGSVSFSSRPEQ